MDLDPSVVWDFAGTLVGTLRERPRQLPATVSRVDPDGTVWLSMPGADGLVPASTTADVRADDAVTVEWWGNAYHVTGNGTSPSVGRRAAAALRRATASAAKVAGEAKGIADAVGQHFWADDNGVHVSNEDGTATGERNILMNSLGILLRQGSAWLASFSDSAVAFYDGLGNEAANIVAQFGADGARIGKLGAAHSVIDANGQRFYGSDGTTQLANIGYGDSNAQSGTSAQPYFTFGERETTTTQYRDLNTYRLGQHVIYNGDEYICIYAITTAEAWNPSHWALAIGGYSTVGGRYSTASGFASHAQNYYATAMGSYSSAGGFYTKATGTASHVEGSDSIASGYGAHAEGAATEASGNDSHAQNSHTIAASDSQTAIGKYNDNDPGNAFEVGNGTADDARSNAFAVGWDGTVTTARDRDTTTWTDVLSSKSSDINITGFKLVQRGQVVSLWIRFQRTTATSAGAAITVGTLSTAYRPLVEAAAPGTSGAGDAYVLESGSVMYRPQSQLAANTNAYIRITYLVA